MARARRLSATAPGRCASQLAPHSSSPGNSVVAQRNGETRSCASPRAWTLNAPSTPRALALAVAASGALLAALLIDHRVVAAVGAEVAADGVLRHHHRTQPHMLRAIAA